MTRILVLGSLNADLVQSVPRLPRCGETLTGGDLQIFAGGKGANQACAAALLGAGVRMAGKVGKDAFGQRLLDELQSAGVDTSGMDTSGAASGCALIFVLPGGENAIVISPGANADVPARFAAEAVGDLQAGDLLLCQLETPMEAVTAALQRAAQKQVVTILDPAPACALPDDLLAAVSILTPNQIEAATILGNSGSIETLSQAEEAARSLAERGPRTVIIKMGAQGCLVMDGETPTAVAGFPVSAIDTTAAGDTFNGALAASLARGDALIAAARFANAAAALSVRRRGAMASMPRVSEVEAFLAARVSSSR